jgi:polyisoprenoid-binding protein YceI
VLSLPAGSHRLDPDNATLRVRTGRRGAAATAGHDLILLVTSWEATLEVAEDPGRSTLDLAADAGSLRVQEGSGGLRPLSGEDKRAIHRNIAEEVLLGRRIEFRSTTVETGPADGRVRVSGELSMAYSTRPVHVELSVGPDGRISARCVLRQSDWGIEPYSALLGALRVADEVEVTAEASLPPA